MEETSCWWITFAETQRIDGSTLYVCYLLLKTVSRSSLLKFAMGNSEKARLENHGYLFVENFMTKELLETIRQRVEDILFTEGDRAGTEFKQEPQSRRLANLVNKGKVFQQIIVAPQILKYVSHIIGPQFKLSSLNFRSADPHSDWV